MQPRVKQIISSTDDPRNLYPNLIDEAAAPYGDDELEGYPTLAGWKRSAPMQPFYNSGRRISGPPVYLWVTTGRRIHYPSEHSLDSTGGRILPLTAH
jgi:hypothetical protein